jgi:hypothetical protein
MTESQIVRQILDWLAAEHIFAFRLNTGTFAGEYKGKKSFTRSHSLGAGAADIFALPDFRDGSGRIITAWWIECKTEKGKLSPEQKSFAEYVQGLGHNYIVARSAEDVAAAIQK